MEFYIPTRLYTGDHIIQQHSKDFGQFGKSCLIVTGKSGAKASGALDDVIEVLKENNVCYEIYDKCQQNPTVEGCLEAAEICKKEKLEFVVGIGGGSALDSAKVVAIAAANDVDEEKLYALKWDNKPLPLLLVGTTAGTGSEMTAVSVLTNSEKRKKSVHSDDCFAIYAYGDPRYTMSLSRNFTVSTALDALAHLVESYFSKKANMISRSFTIEAVKKMYPVLQKLTKEDAALSLEERTVLYDASIIGGMAIAIGGTVFCHNVGYYLTENYGLPHGIACALFMKDLIEFESEKEAKATDEFFESLSIRKEDYLETVTSLLPDFKLDIDDAKLEEILPRWNDNKNVKATLGNMTVADVKEILKKKMR